ncbi:MAG: hypothetical protein NUV42_02155 [Candidatus Yonathbacteria bacterium]|nr:hypothetical protein [Candidatus Yonathbacteria bacterium]
MSSKKTRLPESEAEWLSTGKFQVGSVMVNEKRIRYAITKGLENSRLVIMIGGIPREVEKRVKLPLINKLYGHLAIILQTSGVTSLLYNQPATGGSSGDWHKETLSSRTETLVELVDYFGKQMHFLDYVLIGSSSGACMAINAVEQIEKQGHKVSKLLLLSPAAYPKEVETVPYGKKFTDLLREPWDVATSPVFPKLKKFLESGTSLLLCFFEYDDPPIPLYIQEYYRNFVRRFEEDGVDILVMTIPGVTHNFRRIERKRGSVVDDDSIRATAKIFSTFLK